MLVFPAALAAFALSGSKNYALISFAMVIMAIVPFLMLYEMKKPQAREWIPLAVMAAIAAVGRAAFAALPHFKPVSAIIIITAMTFGPEAGFLTGGGACFQPVFRSGAVDPMADVCLGAYRIYCRHARQAQSA